MKKIIRFSLGFIMAAITIGMLIPFMIVSMFLKKKEKENVQYMGVVSFYPFDKQDRTIGQLIKSKDYEEEQEKINEDCELGYSYGIGNTDVHTSCSFLYV